MEYAYSLAYVFGRQKYIFFGIYANKCGVFLLGHPSN